MSLRPSRGVLVSGQEDTFCKVVSEGYPFLLQESHIIFFHNPLFPSSSILSQYFLTKSGKLPNANFCVVMSLT